MIGDRMNSVSLFSGVGGFDLGFENAGIKTSLFCEQDKKCQSVLQYRWPNTPIHDNVETLTKELLSDNIDVLHGGFPCQDVSYAGRRTGLEGSRSKLFWEFHRILDDIKPRWFVIENVVGLLSSNGGQDMGAVIGALVDSGYGVAYRVLDAQWFGVAQRRRRVFIVGYLGDWRPPAEVLALQQGCSGDIEKVRRERKKTSRSVAACLNSGGNTGGFRTEPGEHLVAYVKTARAGAHPKDGHQRPENWEEGNVAPTLTAFDMGDVRATTLALNLNQDPVSGVISPALGVEFKIGAFGNFGVRRLTPIECERLQGFPDDWTLYSSAGKNVPDTSRYKMMGNAVCVNVAEWIGRRIVEYSNDGIMSL